MCLSWQKLPQHIADNIFCHFSFRALKALSLVCRSWLISVDSYWKDRVILNGDKFIKEDNLNLLSKSFRYFVHLKLRDSDFEQCEKVLNILAKREENNICNLKTLYLYEQTFENVLKILRLSGKSVEKLYITFTDSSVDGFLEYLDWTFEHLNSVKKLTLYFCDRKFLHVTQYLNNLEKLKIGSPNDDDIEIFRTLIEDNKKTLQKLSFQCQPFSSIEKDGIDAFKFLTNIQNLQTLNYSNALQPPTIALRSLLNSQMYLRKLQLDTDDIKNEDLLTIKQELKYLEDFEIDGFRVGISKKSLEIIWSMNNLKSLGFTRCKFPNENIRNIITCKPKLKKLCFCMSNCDDEISQCFIEKCPNLEYLQISQVEGDNPTFRIIQEISENCHHLKFLYIHSRNLLSAENLKNKIFKTTEFFVLETLILYNSKLDENCFKEIKAPNLKKIDLGGMHIVSDASLSIIGTNCPRIEDFSVSCDRELTDSGIIDISKKLNNLKSFKCYSTNITLKAISSIIMNCENLEYSNFVALQKKYFNKKTFENKLQKICDSRYPPLKFTLDEEENTYTLASDWTEVNFYYKWEDMDDFKTINKKSCSMG